MANHNYLDYILRAQGQILLYVDGMQGVIAHKRFVQWLYFKHVVKTALKLLLVFVEYTAKICLVVIDVIAQVDKYPLWLNVKKIHQDFDASYICNYSYKLNFNKKL